jgi:SAM-dependent methyltransferase
VLELDPDQRRALGEAARDRVAEQYSLASVVRQYDALYERVAAEPKRRRHLIGGVLRLASRLTSQLRGDRRSQGSNVDARTVAGFGNEWSTFDQAPLTANELATLFEQYFAIFPWSSLPPDAVGFDLGCGSGRWARLVAPRVHHLHCIDPSPAALQVARHNLAAEHNCSFHAAAVDSIPLPDASMDFGYSLGVLHHVPDTAAGIRSCVAKLKPGAPFLLYIYYAFDNRPLWFRLLWRASDVLRRVVSALPYRAQNAFSLGMATLVYWPLARADAILERFGLNVDALPLSYYRHRSFYVMRTDARDRFGTSLEQRFTARQIEAMMRAADLERITFSQHPPYWCAVGLRGGGVSG